MRKTRTSPSRPAGDGGEQRRSGHGAGSALSEMLRRQALSPRPGVSPPDNDRQRQEARTPQGKPVR